MARAGTADSVERLSPRAALSFARRRGELLALAAMLFATLLFPKAIPPLGVYANGVVTGSALALQSIGLVLVYRANRIVNFAQVQLGALAGVLVAELAVRRQFVAWVATACSACVPKGGRVVLPPGADPADLSSAELRALAAPPWLVRVNYVLALILALVVVYAVTMAVYHLVVKRFSDAPRLVLTLVTIALAEVLAGLQARIPALFGSKGSFSARAPLPFAVHFNIGRSTFEAPDVLRVLFAVAAVIGIGLYLKRSVVGTALRGVADNPSRAETLGVPVRSITSRVWVMAALLSAVVSVLDAASIGASGGGVSAGIVRVLAPAVFAGFVSLPITVVGAVAVSVFDQSVLWAFDSALLTEAFLFIVIVGVLLVLRARRGRADSESSSWSAAREVRPIPVELRSLDSVQRWIRTGAGGAIVVALALPWLLSPSQTNRLSVDIIVGVVALSLLVLTGWAGQISLGQFGFAAVGAWTAAVLHWPFPFGLVAGALAGALVAAVVGIPALRLPGLYLAVTSVAFAVAVPAILLNPRYLAKWLPATVKRPTLLGVDLADERSFYYVVLVFLVLATVAIIGMRRSRTARALVAARDNEAAAQSFGIDLMKARLSAFAVSGFIAAAAGVLFSYATFGVDGAAFGAGASAQVFLVAVLGGLGSIAGPLIGAGFLAIVTAVLPAYVQLTVGGMVILALLLSPGGIGAAVFRMRDAILRRIADRNGILVPSLIADGVLTAADGRAPILPKTVAGRAAFVPRRYRLEGSWVVPSADEAERAGVDGRG